MIKEANWITAPLDAGTAVFTYRRNFCPRKAVKQATLYASAIGVYALFINGGRVGKGVLTPGWTSYRHRVRRQLSLCRVTPLKRIPIPPMQSCHQSLCIGGGFFILIKASVL